MNVRSCVEMQAPRTGRHHFSESGEYVRSRNEARQLAPPCELRYHRTELYPIRMLLRKCAKYKHHPGRIQKFPLDGAESNQYPALSERTNDREVPSRRMLAIGEPIGETFLVPSGLTGQYPLLMRQLHCLIDFGRGAKITCNHFPSLKTLLLLYPGSSNLPLKAPRAQGRLHLPGAGRSEP